MAAPGRSARFFRLCVCRQDPSRRIRLPGLHDRRSGRDHDDDDQRRAGDHDGDLASVRLLLRALRSGLLRHRRRAVVHRPLFEGGGPLRRRRCEGRRREFEPHGFDQRQRRGERGDDGRLHHTADAKDRLRPCARGRGGGHRFHRRPADAAHHGHRRVRDGGVAADILRAHCRRRAHPRARVLYRHFHIHRPARAGRRRTRARIERTDAEDPSREGCIYSCRRWC